ncbi:MAG: shikimate dehydrogenase [Candidatus Omnitrophica bacterium]|nr:shikimate dehydrogenase [Candidatus Omnitrophota bacterium]
MWFASAGTYGLVGYPVQHSFSPAMHNAAFQATKINAKYKLFEKKPEELAGFMGSIQKEKLLGFNVTIPHKESIIKYVDKLTEEAKLVGAVNTVKIENSVLTGHNTDGLGFLNHLMDVYRQPLYGKTVSLLGAGGAGRAVAQYLATEGVAKIIVYDINKDKVEGLAKQLMVNFEAFEIETAYSVDDLLTANPDLLINATHVGMKEEDPLLINPNRLSHNTFVYDLIYNPEETKLLKAARVKGLRCTNGLGMLLNQGILSFEFWTGQKAPVDVMRRALVDAIGRK